MQLFLQFLIRTHDKTWEVKQSLEDKASKIITINGIILPLFFGFILNSYRNVDLLQLILLIGGVFAGTFSIMNAAKVIKPSKFADIINLENFISNNGNLKPEVILRFKNAVDDEIENSAVDNYLRIININEKVNKIRALSLNRAYIYLKGFIMIISIFMIYSSLALG